MNKVISLISCCAAIFILAGCGEDASSGRTVKQTPGVKEVLEAGMAEASDAPVPEAVVDIADERQVGVNEDAPAPLPLPVEEPEAASISADGIDVDLTALSSTMVYSEVYDMMVSPENYIGKMVKMDGMFSIYHDVATDNDYYACVIADATACCSQGIEFVLTDDYTYPDDYPEEGGEICVAGVFDTYQEGENTYCTLRDARLIEAGA